VLDAGAVNVGEVGQQLGTQLGEVLFGGVGEFEVVPDHWQLDAVD
jgi:hypothetical protein